MRGSFALPTGLLIIALACILSPPALAQSQTTRIVDTIEILFPDEFPTAIISPLIQIQTFEIPIVRSIGVMWSSEDQVENVSMTLSVPPSYSASPGVSLERIEGEFVQRVLFNRLPESPVSWLNLTSWEDASGDLQYSEEPEALFGRAQLGWSVAAPGECTAPLSSSVTMRFPPGTKVRYSSQKPVRLEEDAYVFAQYSGFIYVESLKTREATIHLLLALVVTIVLVMFLSASGAIHSLREWGLERVRRIAGGIELRRLVVLFFVFSAITVGMSYIIGPSPRVNLAKVAGPEGSYVDALSGGSVQVVATSERSLELMLEFGVVDSIVIDDYRISSRSEPRWRAIFETANEDDVPIYVGDSAFELNPELFSGIEVVPLPSGEEQEYLAERLDVLASEKKQRNRLGLGWPVFMPLVVILVILSLASISMAAAAAGYLTFYFREKASKSINRLALCMLSFFVFFVFGVLLYTVSSYFLEMPLGWHGPLGKGITAISVLSPSFGGGNFPRAAFALLGLAIITLLFVARRRIHLSFSLLGLFAVMVLYLLVATPLTAPTLFRFISGETSNTPPKDYFSRSSVNSIVSVEYEFQESVAGLFMAILGKDSLDTWLSRGMTASLACAAVFLTLAFNSARTNALIIPVAFLVISRLFARIGDMQIEKSLWTLPTALVIAVLIVILIRALDLFVTGLRNSLEAHRGRVAYLLISVIIPLIVGTTLLYDAAGTDRLLQVIVGWTLLCIAGLSSRIPWEWRQMAGRREAMP